MHKQLSQGENQGTCSQSLGLSSSLIAAKPSKFKSNLWRAVKPRQAPAPRVKPMLGATWQHRSVAVFSEVRSNL